MEITKENVLEIYENARKAGEKNTLNLLEALFGKETFKPRNIMERVKTFEDACDELGENHPFVVQYNDIFDSFLDGAAESNSCDIVAYLKLRIICAALNEGWTPKFTDDELRYYPWFWFYNQKEIDSLEMADRKIMRAEDYETEYAGFAFAHSLTVPSRTYAYSGSRLCLKTGELATYCGTQFTELWADICLIRKCGR